LFCLRYKGNYRPSDMRYALCNFYASYMFGPLKMPYNAARINAT